MRTFGSHLRDKFFIRYGTKLVLQVQIKNMETLYPSFLAEKELEVVEVTPYEI